MVVSLNPSVDTNMDAKIAKKRIVYHGDVHDFGWCQCVTEQQHSVYDVTEIKSYNEFALIRQFYDCQLHNFCFLTKKIRRLLTLYSKHFFN